MKKGMLESSVGKMILIIIVGIFMLLFIMNISSIGDSISNFLGISSNKLPKLPTCDIDQPTPQYFIKEINSAVHSLKTVTGSGQAQTDLEFSALSLAIPIDLKAYSCYDSGKLTTAEFKEYSSSVITYKNQQKTIDQIYQDFLRVIALKCSEGKADSTSKEQVFRLIEEYNLQKVLPARLNNFDEKTINGYFESCDLVFETVDTKSNVDIVRQHIINSKKSVDIAFNSKDPVLFNKFYRDSKERILNSLKVSLSSEDQKLIAKDYSSLLEVYLKNSYELGKLIDSGKITSISSNNFKSEVKDLAKSNTIVAGFNTQSNEIVCGTKIKSEIATYFSLKIC